MTEKKIIKITFNNANKTRVKRSIGQNNEKTWSRRGLNQQPLHSKAIALTIGPRPKVTRLGYLKIVILMHMLCENPQRCLKKIAHGAIRKCRFITVYIVRRPHSCYMYRPHRNSWKRFLYARLTLDASTLCDPTFSLLVCASACAFAITSVISIELTAYIISFDLYP